MTEAEATAIDRELSELRFQVVDLCEKQCGTSLSPCNTGEALSVIAGTIDALKRDRAALIRACKDAARKPDEFVVKTVRDDLLEVVREVTGY